MRLDSGRRDGTTEWLGATEVRSVRGTAADKPHILFHVLVGRT